MLFGSYNSSSNLAFFYDNFFIIPSLSITILYTLEDLNAIKSHKKTY